MWPGPFKHTFLPQSHRGFNQPCGVRVEKKFWYWNFTDLEPRTKSDLDLQYLWSLIYLLISLTDTALRPQSAIVPEKICFHFFRCKSQIWLCHKIGHGQPRVIIWINCLPNTKFQGNRPTGFGEEIFKGVLPYMGMAAILVMWPWPFIQTFLPSSHRGSTIFILVYATSLINYSFLLF